MAASGFASDVILSVDQPPPAYAYSEEKPDYLHFKKVVVSRRSKDTLQFEITLQGDIPPRFPRGSGVRYKVYFDLLDYETKRVEKTKGPDFAEDILISVFTNPGEKRFDWWSHSLISRGESWTIKVTSLNERKDTISFVARSALFEGETPVRVLFGSGILRKNEKGRTKDLGGLDTEVFDLFRRAGGDPREAPAPGGMGRELVR